MLGAHELAIGGDFMRMNVQLSNTYRQNANFAFSGATNSGILSPTIWLVMSITSFKAAASLPTAAEIWAACSFKTTIASTKIWC